MNLGAARAVVSSPLGFTLGVIAEAWAVIELEGGEEEWMTRSEQAYERALRIGARL